MIKIHYYHVNVNSVKPKVNPSPLRIKLDIDLLRVQLVSDVHMESRNDNAMDNIVKVSADVLALCGDIGYPYQKSYFDILSWASRSYKWTFLITGNHEYYNKHKSIDEIDDKVAELVKEFPNITFLQNNMALVNYNNGSTMVFGSTLWSKVTNIGAVGCQMNDYSLISHKLDGSLKRITPQQTTGLHKIAVCALTETINYCTLNKLPLVIMTHHLPSYSCIHNDFMKYDDISSAFASDLDNLIKVPISLWMHGHSHRYMDFKINDVRVISNPLGYQNEDTKGYMNDLVISIETPPSIESPT